MDIDRELYFSFNRKGRNHLVLVIFLLLHLYVNGVKASDLRVVNNTVIANSDIAIMNQGEEIKINVLNNDFGLEDGVASLVISVESQYAETTVTENNEILYKPDPSFNGKDEFTYKVCNVNGSCDEAKVSVEVSYFNYIPLANNDTVVAFAGEDINIDVLNNDEGIFDAPLDLIIITDLNEGYASVNNDLSVNAIFDTGFTGVDSLQYQVCDADNDCDDAWVFIHIKTPEGYEVFIPQGISPNGDGLNDVFYVPDFKDKNLEIQIITSIGEVVFKDLNYQNNWDGIANTGKYKGQLLKQGTYYYTIKVLDSKDVYSGYVYLNW
ncbi:Ig-like domain-containing protein [Saccharicrinis aurantiacus]|uniref:Ig-like domain-containing protein n=1 Tax=Saccharicrinis aurantiacus TaxID=1849719 RepID=UPI0024917023|nr:gliding motility-associated C-terminal domain-containing protein [Saccharicrinis aurantiacus]